MDGVMETAPCGFFILDDDAKIIECNTTLAEMLRWEKGEIIGYHVDRIFPPGGRIFYHTHVFPLLKVEGFAEEIYLALRARDGSDVPILLNAVRRRSSDGPERNEFVVVKMIQRHQFEDQLIQARRLAEKANAAKARFLSMVSHDLRTPLTAVQGNADLLALDSALLEDRQAEMVAQIRFATKTLRMMLDDILDFAQIEAGQLRVRIGPVSVSEAMTRAARLLRMQAADAELTLRTITCAEDVVVDADPDKLQQILLNLLTNAIKFTPVGGSIDMQCDAAGDRACIHVRDTGPGIPEGEVEKIFSPFVQLDAVNAGKPRSGVGLGLAISRELARAMGGDVTVRSVPGAGATFTIWLSPSVTEGQVCQFR